MSAAPKTRMRGVGFALSAALLWGLIPLYIDVVDAYDPMEIVAHRALWSGVLLLIFMALSGSLRIVPMILADSQMRRGLIISASMLTFNWVVFVYSVRTGQLVEAALGYFIYPLAAVVLGFVVLREKLDRMGWIAVGFVLAGVLVKTNLVQGVPWIGLGLAASLGVYGVVRKQIGLDPFIGMFVETLLVMPLAIGYLVWMAVEGQPLFYGGGTVNVMLALLAGVITVVPLLLYHVGNRDLPMAMASLLFYVNPSTQLLLGLFYFGGAFTIIDGMTFGLIWIGITIYFATRRRAPAATIAGGA